jgi:hypothetical protein
VVRPIREAGWRAGLQIRQKVRQLGRHPPAEGPCTVPEEPQESDLGAAGFVVIALQKYCVQSLRSHMDLLMQTGSRSV